MTRSLVLAVFMLLALRAAETRADPPEPAKADLARAHYRQGEAYFRAGAFDVAAREYLEAYQAAPRPLLLFNAALAFEKAGDPATAVTYYERYLEAEPAGERGEEARARLLVLRRAVPPTRSTPAAATDLPPSPPIQTSVAPATHDAPVESKASPMNDAPPSVERRDTGRSLRVAGIAVLGLGVAALAAGIAWGVESNQLADDATEAIHKGDPARAARLQDDFSTARRSMTIAYVAAATLAGGGTVLYYFGRRRATITPVATPNVAAIVVTGWF
jgi:tetratricopeptide (TPR) repeat protein